MGELTFYIGGAKSGKTRLAQAKAESYPAPRIYLATAQALDGEMEVRIKRHQAERGEGWQTLENPLEPDQAIKGLKTDGVIMVDCLTLWLSNLMGAEMEPAQIMERVDSLAQASINYPGPVIIVSNEVGGGIVPMNKMAREFRDLAGAANQLLAARAHQVVLAVAGLELKVK